MKSRMDSRLTRYERSVPGKDVLQSTVGIPGGSIEPFPGAKKLGVGKRGLGRRADISCDSARPPASLHHRKSHDVRGEVLIRSLFDTEPVFDFVESGNYNCRY